MQSDAHCFKLITVLKQICQWLSNNRKVFAKLSVITSHTKKLSLNVGKGKSLIACTLASTGLT
jgi:hypothetical protein